MPWRHFSLVLPLLIWIGSLALTSCATPDATREPHTAPPSRARDVRPASVPAPPVKMHQLHIQELTIPQADLNQYPALATSHVGEGLSQLLIRVLTEMQRFEFSVPPSELAWNLSESWGPNPAGISMQANSNQIQGQSMFNLSVKLFDIALCQPVSHLASAQPQSVCRSRVGVQVRLEAPSGQFIPGATHPLSPQARHLHAETLPLLGNSDVVFHQSALGPAAAKAMQYALLQAVERLDRQGW